MLLSSSHLLSVYLFHPRAPQNQTICLCTLGGHQAMLGLLVLEYSEHIFILVGYYMAWLMTGPSPHSSDGDSMYPHDERRNSHTNTTVAWITVGLYSYRLQSFKFSQPQWSFSTLARISMTQRRGLSRLPTTTTRYLNPDNFLYEYVYFFAVKLLLKLI